MFFSSETWLTAADLFVESTGKTREVTFTIAKVVKGNLTGVGGKKSNKPALHWEEKAKDGSPIKPLAVGAKCCAQIAQATGSTDMADWPGKKVTLFVDQDRVSGEMRPCIRVRAFQASQQRAARGEVPDDDEQRAIKDAERKEASK
jgi:hypothetical protein